MIDLNNVRHIHLIGIGGVSVSAIAEILFDDSFIITGSDQKESMTTDSLKEKGIKVFIGHDADHVVGADLIVYTSAAGNDNCEIIKAKELNIPMISRSEMLGHLMSDYKTSFAVSGTHGKTTTTSMISTVLNATDLKPTMLTGAYLPQIQGNVRIGLKDIFVTEACEYKENFLDFNHNVGIILNVEEDHLDYYEGIDHIVSAFTKFSKKIPKSGTLVVNNDDYNAKKVISHIDCNLVTFGINQESMYHARNIVFDNDANGSFDIYLMADGTEEKLGQVSLQVPGNHNIYNALAAAASLHNFGIDFALISQELGQFSSPNRRFQVLGKYKGATIIDDYAHHPTELKVTIATANRLDHNRLITIFQPHTFSRTKSLMTELSTAFKSSDYIIISDIYAARETDNLGISSLDLVNAIRSELSEDQELFYIANLNDVNSHLKNIITSEDTVLFLGAGNINSVGKSLIE